MVPWVTLCYWITLRNAMENSVDRYLHKKFKKQLSIEPQKVQYDNDKAAKEAKTVSLPVSAADDDERNVPLNRTNEQTGQCHKVVESCSDNNKSVPNESTNQNSLPVRNSYNYACSYVESSISDLNEIGDRATTNLTTTVNTCISYVISNSDTSQAGRTAGASRPEHHLVRTLNFDTNFNQNEPISNKSSVIETSSILDNTEQTYVTTSKLGKVVADREDVSSSTNHCEEQVGRKHDEVQESNPPLPDKNTGGKYVCTYCNLACSKPSVLQKHIRAHTNERPYPCVSCGFSFKTRSNLYKHCRSRTHANRVMGNKAQELNNEMDMIENQNRPEEYTSERPLCEQVEYDETAPKEQDRCGVPQQDIRTKPYKPRFHTAKIFFDTSTKETKETEKPESPLIAKHSNSDLLSIHINELINKNNSIVNSSDPYLMKKRYASNVIDDSERHKDTSIAEEPLNLTNKNRKRCLSQSEVSEPTTQKSLIKELLLKNLYADSNMQCRYCKMIFQTVTEFELHKLRSCRGANKSGMRYSRSSSVNVASILTHNKNAFDSIPHMQNTVFNMKSPGPFLGKTRLVESDKNKSFSFDDVLPTTLCASEANNRAPYALSPLVLHNDKDKEKRSHVKLFGGEVKITHRSGETKSFKIDNKEGDKFSGDSNYVEYGGKLSENRVVKSSLQSGGTVLTNKPNYSKNDLAHVQNIIHVYDSPNSPRADIERSVFDKHEFSEGQRDVTKTAATSTSFSNGMSYKYTNIVDFSQKAAKLLAPNLKQLNLSITGIPSVNNNTINNVSELTAERKQEQLSAVEFAQKQIALAAEPPPPLPSDQQNLYNPMNLIVNGKVVRYVPGIPGPVVADTPLDVAYASNIMCVTTRPPPQPSSLSPLRLQRFHSPVSSVTEIVPSRIQRSPPETTKVESATSKMEELEIKTTTTELKSSATKSAAESRLSNDTKSPMDTEMRKFARPSSLALKPSMAAIKQHHGLTPTMFNQILISPDTPRVAKKYMQHFLHGNYFSYLGLKSSTKPVYCTLNKTQPFYVQMKHFKKLSMYSEWRQQDNKTDKLYCCCYDSGQKQQKYTMAGKTTADLIVHSSYKFTVTETKPKSEEQKISSVLGGYKSNEDYTYIRGRGRGRYVCDQCGIRCKKPSMLKKHIRTHSNDRPYTCSHCNFSFKTKGNLTKHMKSKSHTKNYAASSGSSTSSNQQSGTQSSESETEDSGMDSSDESTTRQQEHEAAYGLLSLSQKTTSNMMTSHSHHDHQQTTSAESSNSFMNTEQIVHVTKTNFAKNKILDQQANINFIGPRNITDLKTPPDESSSKEIQNLTQFLGKTNTNRPLTYPYTVVVANETRSKCPEENETKTYVVTPENELKSITQFNVIMRYGNSETTSPKSDHKIVSGVYYEQEKSRLNSDTSTVHAQQQKYLTSPIIKVNDRTVFNENNENVAADLRKRKISTIENSVKLKVQKNDEVMDLSMTTNNEKSNTVDKSDGNGEIDMKQFNYDKNVRNKSDASVLKMNFDHPANENFKPSFESDDINYVPKQRAFKMNELLVHVKQSPQVDENSRVSINYVVHEQPPVQIEKNFRPVDYDNSAMETLADIATKQVKLEKNILAKSVASEYLKLATKNEFVINEGSVDGNSFVSTSKEVNELILKPEENKSCTICAKNFNKPSQLRLHMNVHYLERPFRCDSCAVSFRTKGHLQKHERSASHHNKLSSSPALSSSEPRPFKCSDCNIAFRIHGHLAKHLRSKMHIMKLECLAKIPFGLYAELERSNSLLTEINTSDGDQCLESLKTLAKKVFVNDPSKLNQMEEDS